MYYGNVEGSNLCLRGDSSSSVNNINALGAYSCKWVQCSGWPETSNYSLCKWSREADAPKIKTDQGNAGNYSFDVDYRYGGRNFSFGIKGQNASTSKYGYSTPFSTTTSGGGTLEAYVCGTMSSYQSNIGTTALATYPWFFAGWRLESTSGTFLTSTASVNWYHNSDYGGVNMAYIKYLAATFITL
tara:strand:+ start:320 stop:877 length:558 start_codon:yes stop_codon:yes gene_type:complete